MGFEPFTVVTFGFAVLLGIGIYFGYLYAPRFGRPSVARRRLAAGLSPDKVRRSGVSVAVLAFGAVFSSISIDSFWVVLIAALIALLLGVSAHRAAWREMPMWIVLALIIDVAARYWFPVDLSGAPS